MKPGVGGALPTALAALVVSALNALRPLQVPTVATPVTPVEYNLTANATCDCHCECEFVAPFALSSLGWAVATVVLVASFCVGVAVGRCCRPVRAPEASRGGRGDQPAITPTRPAGGKGQITFA